MTQNPITVSYSLEEILGQLNQKLDRVDDKLGSLQKEIAEIKVGQARLETEVQGISKRLDTQEFINRSVVVGFVLALAAGAVKLFFPGLPSQ